MDYELEALVGKEALLRKHQSTFRNVYVVPVTQGLALIPMTGALWWEINSPASGELKARLYGFKGLTSAVEAWAGQISRDGEVAYIEATDIADGYKRDELAMVWQNGAIAAGPLHNITQALDMLGLEHPCRFDDDDPAGFGRYHRTAAWETGAIVDNFEEHAGGAITGLVEALRFEDSSVRREAAHRLGTMGAAARGAGPALIQALRDPDEYFRGRAATALGKIGSKAHGAVAALIEALKNDKEAWVRMCVAEALGEIGPEAQGAASALKKALSDQQMVREAAGEALKKILTHEKPSGDR